MTSDNSLPTLGGGFQPDPAQFQDLAPGYFLGEHQNYRLEKKLGEGGMGQTWLAVKVVGGRDFQKVVCKLLVQELRDDADAMKEVERVFHLTQSLYHPNICPLLGIDMDPVFGTFLVMAYAEGETLREWFQAQPGHENGLPMSSVLPILHPIADALDTVHREGVFHRDVKPENIVFRKPGEFDHPLLLDFGIAARIHTEETNTTTGRSRTNSGTPAYMAPEQHMAEQQNASTDQYSLAVLTYELLAGRLPFPGRNREHYAVLKTLPPSPIAHLPAPVNNALFRALNREMTARFPTCTAFFEALRNGEEQERLEQERLEQERLEQERLEQERLEQERLEQERLEQERLEQERLEQERLEQERLEQERLEQERLERERLEQERLEQELNGQFKYEISGDFVTITKYIGSTSAVTIPHGVTCIGNWTFSGRSSLTSVMIPDSVTSIGEGTFSACSSLTSVTIPNSVTNIGSSAFRGCRSLTSVTIPNSVTNIGKDAFYDCPRLTIYGTEGSAAQTYAKSNEIPFSTDPSPYCDAAGVCYSHDGKTLLGAPQSLSGEYTIPDSVTSIGKDAFQYCSSLTSVTIPNSVTSIGNMAFDGCNSLTSMTIPNSVTSIGYSAFSRCKSLTSVTIPNSVTSIGYHAFGGCSSLTSVTIPNSVTSIGYYAFSGCDSLTSVTIPDSVTSIGNYAFYYCKNLTSVMIPNSVTSIGNEAFIFCESLTSVTIPNGVTSIGYAPFTGCDKLTEIQVSAGNTHFKSVDGILFSADGKTLIQVPAGKGLTECTIPNSVTSIGSYAFSFCESLTSVTIPKSVTSIGNRAFGGCESLTIYGTPGSEAEKYAKEQEIQFQAVAPASAAKPASTTEVSREALKATLKKWKFEYTIDGNTVTITKYIGSASAVTIPHGVTSIGGSAFWGCKNLTSVTIPNGVTSIGDHAFSKCGSLTSVTIPESVTSIGDHAFYDCESLKSVTIPDSVTSIGREAFAGCPLMVQLKVKWFKLTHGI